MTWRQALRVHHSHSIWPPNIIAGDNGLAFYCLRRRRDAAMQVAAASLAKRQSLTPDFNDARTGYQTGRRQMTVPSSLAIARRYSCDSGDSTMQLVRPCARCWQACTRGFTRKPGPASAILKRRMPLMHAGNRRASDRQLARRVFARNAERSMRKMLVGVGAHPNRPLAVRRTATTQRHRLRRRLLDEPESAMCRGRWRKHQSVLLCARLLARPWRLRKLRHLDRLARRQHGRRRRDCSASWTARP